MSGNAQKAEKESQAPPAAGPYELFEQLGRGGMGVVYRARRRDWPQSLAVKILRPSSSRAAERFAREQEILAQLDHPAIVRFLDSGSSPAGDVYYVMELVDGLPIDRYCDATRLGVRDRIRLFLEVCAAVSHAHRNLVVHRDLKPANVLVDREGRPRLLDFGIAKWLDRGETGQDTTRGATPMTLRYASPEQVRGQPVGVGTDVYSLSVMLYELLAGDLPQAASLDLYSLAVAIDRQAPPPASQMLRERGDKAGAQVLAGDLDEVLAKGLAKDPAERYASVAALAADLGRYLDHRPVLARRPSVWRQIRYFAARNRAATALSVLLLAILAFSAAAFAQRSRAVLLEKERAQQAQARAQARVELIGMVFAETDPLGSGPLATLSDALDAVSFDLERKLAANEALGPSLAATAGEAYFRLDERERAGSLAARALRAEVPIAAGELAQLLALTALAQPAAAQPAAPQPSFAAEIGGLRQAAMRRSGIAACELAPAWDQALAEKNATEPMLSLATELSFTCALENGDWKAARDELARLERQRQSAGQAAIAELTLLRQALDEAEARAVEALR